MFGGTLEGPPGAGFGSPAAAVAAVAAVFAAGVAIKLMDDFVDRHVDALGGTVTWAGRMGDGALPYAMAALAVSMLLDASVGGTLFLAAYALGMAHDGRRRLPSGLLGWHESLAAAAAGALLAGPWRMAASLAALTFVQCVDDLIDAGADARRGRRSLVAALGTIETCLLGLAALVVAEALAPIVTTAVVVCSACVVGLTSRLAPAAGRRRSGWLGR